MNQEFDDNGMANFHEIQDVALPAVSENEVAESGFKDVEKPVSETTIIASEEELPAAVPPSSKPEKSSDEVPSEKVDDFGEPIGQRSSGEDSVPSANYSDANYLFYGGIDVPEGIDYEGTLTFLVNRLKYDGGELRQARQNKDGSGIIVPEEKSTEVCSYCGLPISGVDYYRLPDGRKRCTNCNRSLIKSLEELNRVFNDVLLNMEIFFGAVIDVPISVEMLEERKLKKKIGKGLGNPPPNALILGVAVEKAGKYTVYVENGIPRISLISTLAHELTHIWQYLNWDDKAINDVYGRNNSLEVYEGMAKWAEIQYLILLNEIPYAKRQEIATRLRQDAYGQGFIKYAEKYPLTYSTKVGNSPFNENPPL